MKYIAALLALLFSSVTAYAATIGGGTLHGAVLLGAAQEEESDFVSFQESTTFGPGGSIADYASRFSIPKEIGVPPDPTDSGLFTQYDDMKDAGCSSDETTWAAIKAEIGSSNNKTIWLPDDCKVRIFINPTSGDGAEYTLTGNDGINFYCENPEVCGFELRYDAFDGVSPGRTSDQHWDWTTDDAYGEQIQRGAIQLGSTRSSALQDCNWTDGYDIGSKMIETDCTISLSGGSAWGPGDIVRLIVDDIPGAEVNSWGYLTRVSCVRDSSGTLDPSSDPTGTLCNEINEAAVPGGTNLLQIEDGLPMDYNPDAYYWGDVALGLGDSYTLCDPVGNTCTGGDTSTYVDTDGHTVEQIERVGSTRGGNGTETTQISEGITFWKVGWSIFPEFIGSKYVVINDNFETHFYRNIFDGRVGGEMLVHIGPSASGGEGGRTNFYANGFIGGPFKTTCFGEILAIRQTNPVEVDVLATDGCSFSGSDPPVAGNDDMIGFTSDVADSTLAGNVFIRVQGSLDSGPPIVRTVELKGIDGTCSTGICVDTTPGGLAVSFDNYAQSTVYVKRSSNTQVQHNYFIDTAQNFVTQSGAVQLVYNGNFETSPNFRNVRGPFLHGNAGGPGHIFSLNDQDNAFVPLEESNRGNSGDNGEGTNHTWFKNRCRQTSSTTWPGGSYAGTDYSTRGTCFAPVFEDQWGSVNEDWNILLNAGEHIVNGSTAIDDLSNLPDFASGTDSAPHLVYKLFYHRNRSGTGNNQDDNFAGNASTTRDNSGSDTDESDSVPGGWASEIGLEPTGIWEKPAWWDSCTGVGTYGEIGAYYDAIGGTYAKLASQVLSEGGSCGSLD